MSEHIEGVVPAESVEISDEAISDFIDRGGEAPSFHPVLEVWRAVLEPAVRERDKKVTPQYANRIVQSYPGLTYADMPVVQERYFDIILELASALESVIESDDECLHPTTPAEDVEANSGHYKDLVVGWQLILLDREMKWEATDPAAAAEIAAIGEVHKMFFSEQGLTAYLDNIQFQFTDADRAELAELIEQMREGQ